MPGMGQYPSHQGSMCNNPALPPLPGGEPGDKMSSLVPPHLAPGGGGSSQGLGPPPPPLPVSGATPPPPPGQGGGMANAPSWQGNLAKSGGPLCTLICLPEAGGSDLVELGGGSDLVEPRGWPSTLDVKLRVDLQYIVHQLYSNTPRSQRAYLAAKGRAGVIKLEPAGDADPRTLYLVPPSSSNQGMDGRTSYHVPPSFSACASLGVEWDPRDVILALVLPTPSQGRDPGASVAHTLPGT
eukprot:gene2545-4116_t